MRSLSACASDARTHTRTNTANEKPIRYQHATSLVTPPLNSLSLTDADLKLVTHNLRCMASVMFMVVRKLVPSMQSVMEMGPTSGLADSGAGVGNGGGGGAPTSGAGEVEATTGEAEAATGEQPPNAADGPAADLSNVKDPKHGLWSKKNLSGGEEQATAVYMAEVEKKDFLTGEERATAPYEIRSSRRTSSSHQSQIRPNPHFQGETSRFVCSLTSTLSRCGPSSTGGWMSTRPRSASGLTEAEGLSCPLADSAPLAS